MTAAQAKVAKARAQLDEAIADQQEERRRRRILCSCGKMHPIGKLDLLVTHYYIEPHGCTGGDYWREGEWQFLCPYTGERNRLLFDDYDLDWKDRDTSKAAGVVFKYLYRGLFANTIDTHGDADESKYGRAWANNYYIDQHRERFELPPRAKQR
jgi:hypothetical protein